MTNRSGLFALNGHMCRALAYPAEKGACLRCWLPECVLDEAAAMGWVPPSTARPGFLDRLRARLGRRPRSVEAPMEGGAS